MVQSNKEKNRTFATLPLVPVGEYLSSFLQIMRYCARLN